MRLSTGIRRQNDWHLRWTHATVSMSGRSEVFLEERFLASRTADPMEHAMSRICLPRVQLAGLLLLVPAATAVETFTITETSYCASQPGVTHRAHPGTARSHFPVLETQGEWYKILLEDGRGWITQQLGV